MSSKFALTLGGPASNNPAQVLLARHGTHVYSLRSSRHKRSRHQAVYLPPHNNSAIIHTVYLPGVVTSSSSPNISLSIFIDTLHRTSHLQRFFFLRGAICLKSNSLSYENWLLLSLEPYLLRFHCHFESDVILFRDVSSRPLDKY